MRLIIDKENVNSLLQTVSKDTFILFDCIRILKEGLDIIFNFKEFDKSQELKFGEFLRYLADGRIGRYVCKYKWEETINSSEIKTNFVTNLKPEQKRDAYLLTLNKEEQNIQNKQEKGEQEPEGDRIIELIKEKGAILIGGKGEEYELLKSLDLRENQKPILEIESWKDYCPDLPLTDFIIADNHFFLHPDKYISNIHNLIEGICKLLKNSSVCGIIFINTDINYLKEFNPIVRYDDSLSKKQREELENEDLKLEDKVNLYLKFKQLQIKEILKTINKKNNNRITIIKTSSLHDRHIITNYYRLDFGSTTLKGSDTKKDITIDTKSHVKKNADETTDFLLGIYQDIIRNNEKTIIGDKESNLLKFDI